MRRKSTAPPPGGADPVVLLEEAVKLGGEIAVHQAAVTRLAARRKDVLIELVLSWTHRDIAEELGVSQARVNQIINGRRRRAHKQEQGPD